MPSCSRTGADHPGDHDHRWNCRHGCKHNADAVGAASSLNSCIHRQPGRCARPGICVEKASHPGEGSAGLRTARYCQPLRPSDTPPHTLSPWQTVLLRPATFRRRSLSSASRMEADTPLRSASTSCTNESPGSFVWKTSRRMLSQYRSSLSDRAAADRCALRSDLVCNETITRSLLNRERTSAGARREKQKMPSRRIRQPCFWITFGSHVLTSNIKMF